MEKINGGTLESFIKKRKQKCHKKNKLKTQLDKNKGKSNTGDRKHEIDLSDVGSPIMVPKYKIM